VTDRSTPRWWLGLAVEPECEPGKAGIYLIFAELKGLVKDKLRRFGLLTRFDERHFFVTVGQVVDANVESGSVDWEDWEERGEKPLE
jgi:hypothetical protein